MKVVSTIKPNVLLSPYIESYNIREISTDFDAIFPSFKAHVLNIFLLGHYELENVETKTGLIAGSSLIIGQQSRHNWNIRLGGKLKMISVQFLPAGLHSLIGINMNELLDRFIWSQELFGNEFKEVEFKISACSSLGEMALVLDEFFLRLFRKKEQKHEYVSKAVNYCVANNSYANMSWVAGQANLSLRQFERKFKEVIGTSPKSFFRKERFMTALDYSRNLKSGGWLDVVYDTGYFDQAHLIRDFRYFTSFTPSEYKRKTEKFEIITY